VIEAEADCTCEPLADAVCSIMPDAKPVGRDEGGDICVCEDMACANLDTNDHVNTDRFNHGSESCACDPLPVSLCAYMPDAVPLGLDADENACSCHDMKCAAEDGDGTQPHVNIDRFEQDGILDTDCVCEALPDDAIVTFGDACPLGQDSSGDDCVCFDMCTV
jgi:hypothetical protein